MRSSRSGPTNWMENEVVKETERGPMTRRRRGKRRKGRSPARTYGGAIFQNDVVWGSEHGGGFAGNGSREAPGQMENDNDDSYPFVSDGLEERRNRAHLFAVAIAAWDYVP